MDAKNPDDSTRSKIESMRLKDGMQGNGRPATVSCIVSSIDSQAARG